LNSQHGNIKFTVEYGSDSMCFLDVEIKVTDDGCDTWTWRKPTHTGLLLNYNALCPIKWKSGLILCLLNRAKSICSTRFLFNKEVFKLRQMFASNGYPNSFFNKILNRFLCTCNRDNLSNLSKCDEPEPDLRYFVSVPFIGKDSRRFVNRLAKLLDSKFNAKVIGIFKTVKVGSYFQLKSNTPFSLCKNVVYKFTCSCDMNLTYFGKCSRHLSTRANEHLDLTGAKKSAIKQHLLSCSICAEKSNLNSFVILKKCTSDFQAKIHEALLIKKHRPTLNSQLYAQGSSVLLNVYK